MQKGRLQAALSELQVASHSFRASQAVAKYENPSCSHEKIPDTYDFCFYYLIFTTYIVSIKNIEMPSHIIIPLLR